jgi:hypothetical protein
LNPRPDRVYKLAYKGCVETGLEHYLDIGYDVVAFEKGGPTISGCRQQKVGEPIEYQGSILVSIDAQRAKEIELYGEWGDAEHPESGQAEVDRLEEMIIDKRGGIDPLRGLHATCARAGMVFYNDTEPLRPSYEEP